MRKLITFLLSLFLVASFSPFTPAIADTDEYCQFGETYIDEGEDDYGDPVYSCEKTTWEYSSSSDGFDKKTIISMPEDLAGLPGSTTINKLDMYVRCTSKKLEVYFASSYTLFDSDNRVYSNKLQYRVDSGSVRSTTFSESTDDQAFFVTSAKTFMTNVSKGKSKILIKFSDSDGTQISQFPIADLSKYKSKFKSAGCSY
jgi:hypothetical protein